MYIYWFIPSYVSRVRCYSPASVCTVPCHTRTVASPSPDWWPAYPSHTPRLCLFTGFGYRNLLTWFYICIIQSIAVHGVLQARTLDWVVLPFSRGCSQPRDQTQVSSRVAGGFFTSWASREACYHFIFVFFPCVVSLSLDAFEWF